MTERILDHAPSDTPPPCAPAPQTTVLSDARGRNEGRGSVVEARHDESTQRSSALARYGLRGRIPGADRASDRGDGRHGVRARGGVRAASGDGRAAGSVADVADVQRGGG